MEQLTLLREFFGHDSFRPSQEEAISHLLEGEDLLAIMPTGAGKSICYQIPALMFDGVTLVISPLISLMKDQVTALVQNGIPAAYLNSSLTPQQHEEVLRRACGGRYKLIYIAPERLSSASFRRFCTRLPIAMVTVDEAHCVSQWGQDFRPSYLDIADFIAWLPERPIVSAFTATATDHVRRDIISLLQLRDPHRIITSFDRKNLFFSVQRPPQKDLAVLQLVRQRTGEAGIIYCQTRKAVEGVCAMLLQNGLPATRYHAGLSPEERQQNQEDFLFDRKPIMVATNAFGMGIDKSNVSYVIHYNMPTSLENYYQEAGRAGRDGCAADCILLYDRQDVTTARYLLTLNHPLEGRPQEEIDHFQALQMRRLRQMDAYCNCSGCLRQHLLGYFGESLSEPCGNCGSCLSGFDEVDVTQDAQKLLSCVCRVARAGYRPERDTVFQILQGKPTEAITLLKLDKLSTFGLMRGVPTQRLEKLTLRLTERGMLRLTGEDRPVLEMTERAKPLLYGRQRLTLLQPRPKSFGLARAKPKQTVDAALFEQLRQLRQRLARRLGVPPYALFSDATLREMCRRLPLTVKQLRRINGMSDIKCQRYAQDLLPLLQEYHRQHPR